MPLLVLEGITKFYGSEPILEGISLAIDRRERLGLIGANGSGKTTLLRLMLGALQPEEGRRVISRGTRVGYLPQEPDFADEGTVWSEIISAFAGLRALEARLDALAGEIEHEQTEGDQERVRSLLEQHARLQGQFEADGGWEYETQAKTVLTGVGLPEERWARPTSGLSGGEKSRAALAKLLLTRPDLLLLDEPTNHLDIAGIDWLEEYLRDFPGAVVVVAHDRHFLDHAVQRIVEVEDRELVEYGGGYTDYVRQRQERALAHGRAYVKQQREIERQKAIVRFLLGTGNEKLVRRARSREKLLDRMDIIDPPPAQRRKLKLAFAPQKRGGDEVANLEGVGKTFAERRLFAGVDLHIQRRQRVAVVGPNGCGKTTLLNIILGHEDPTEGEAALGRSVDVGYYEQQPEPLDPDTQVIDVLADLRPRFTPGETRSLLARFLFVGDDVFKLAGQLSGGEQARLLLARLILSGPNFLALDEPTNHLDIDSRNAVENALLDYQGTVLLVSHDRYLVDRVCNRVVAFDSGRVRVHEGNYSDYVRRRQERSATAEAAREDGQRPARATRQAARSARRTERAGGRASSEELEERVHDLEAKLERLEARLQQLPADADPRYAMGLSNQHAALGEQLREALAEWEAAAEDKP